jgi:hypothetical protein
LNALPFGNSQLACAWVSGVAAATGAAAEGVLLGAAAAGLMSTDAPMLETMKRRLSAIARTDVLLNPFIMLFVRAFAFSLVGRFVICLQRLIRAHICVGHRWIGDSEE